MTTCIYYDLENVRPDDVRRARAQAGGGPEIIADGVLWPDEIAGPAPHYVLNPRDVSYQDELMDWTSRLFDELRASPRYAAFGCRENISLLEVARYSLLFNFAAVEQRWRAFCEIGHRFGCDRVVWVAPSERCGELALLGRSSGGAAIDLIPTTTRLGLTRRLYLAARRIAGPVIKPWLARLARIAHPPEPLPPRGGSRVVFAEYFPNSSKALLPIARALGEQGIDVCWLAAREPVRDILRKNGVGSQLLSDISVRARDPANGLTPDGRRNLELALDELPHEMFCGTGGAGGRGYLLPALQRQIGKSLDEAAYWVEGFLEAFAVLRPDFVVSTTYSGIVGRAASMAARARGAVASYVQHGIIPANRAFWHFANDDVQLLLWGQSDRRNAVRCGIAESRVHVTGATLYDPLAALRPASRGSTFPATGEPVRVAFMASRTGGAALTFAAAKRCLETVAEGISRVPQGHLTVKVHPADRTSMVADVMQRFPRFAVFHSGSSQDVIRAADLVIVVSSTTGLEACAADKPLLLLEVPGAPNFVPYASYGAALNVGLSGPDAAATLAETIRRLQADPQAAAALTAGRQRLRDDMLAGARGDAAEVAARAIAEQLRSPSGAIAGPCAAG